MKLIEYFTQRNIKLGLLFFVIATSVALFSTFYFISGFLLTYDFQFLIGAIIGCIYGLRNRTPDQTILKCGLIIGIVGGVLSALVISILVTLINLLNFFDFFLAFGLILLTGIPVGLLVGAIISSYFMYTEVKGEEDDEEKYDDDFYKDLIEK